MADTNNERVGKALDLLKEGLSPFVAREMKTALSSSQVSASDLRRFTTDPMLSKRPVAEWDVAGLLALMWETWNQVFREILGPAERGYVGELRGHRTRWAHQEPFSTDDAYRALDSTYRLLTSISAPEAGEIEKMKMELLRLRFAEQARTQRRRTTSPVAESQTVSGLPAWREIVSPHQDVAGGQYQQAEFAADLWQVYLGEAVAEYQDPAEFYRRTFLTDSLRRLLINAVKRLSANEGDPVVQLQTNFGGGKTHSMLALFHLFSGSPHGQLSGVDDLMQEAGTSQLPAVNRVVLVGNRISPGNPIVKGDGTEVRTLWGELAWQLGLASGGEEEARKAYERVRADDERATNPGDTLRELLNEYGPSLILIDEWVAYARQLHDESDLPAGSFETQFTFAQALSESAKLANNCLLVISLPASEATDATEAVEVGGVRGRESLNSLRNVIGRVESPWRSASAEESFEIVRRRLFQPITDEANFVLRDNVARAYGDLYRKNRQEFPPECGETAYEDRIKAAYPIHPEVFERLYTDWSTLQNFQRTRGVLRLMAAVIHSLWENGDRSPLIMPANVLLDEPSVQSELNHYLPDNWPPVIERDIDGPNSLSSRTDGEVPNLGRYSACRRVARTIFLGSAPTPSVANQGLEDRRIKLGCVNPGESAALYGDAMRRLASTATYLYQDGTRYWYSTQPTVTTLADSRAEEYRRDRDKVDKEIKKRLDEDLKTRGDFKGVHVFPDSGQDVQDDHDARLVVLGPSYPHAREQEGDTRAVSAAKAIWEYRGSTPRLFRNTLAFLTADQARLDDLDDAVRRYLAWESILADRERLDLPPHQVKQAETRKQESDNAVRGRIGETYQWLLVPKQSSPTDEVKWEAIRLSGQGALADRASRRMRSDELLITSFAGTRLRMELDKIPLWRGEHVSIRQLIEDFCRYSYLPRLQEPKVLLDAVRGGISLLTWEQDTFAYAESYDEAAGRYRGLRSMESISLSDADPGLVVRPDVARRQLVAEAVPVERPVEGVGIVDIPRPGEPGEAPSTPGSEPPIPPAQPKAKRYHGSVKLDATRVGRDASQIADEVIAHLSGLLGADVKLTLEIEANIPDGTPEQVIRIVTENSRTLKFDDSGFENE